MVATCLVTIAFAAASYIAWRATRPAPPRSLLRFNADLGADVTLQMGFGSVEDMVCTANTGGAQFGFSQSGDLVFVTGKSSGFSATVAWLDGSGKTGPLRAAPGSYYQPRFSPYGKQFAVMMAPDGGEAKPPNHVTFLLNFAHELRRRVSVAAK